MSSAHGAGLMLLPVVDTHGTSRARPADRGGRDVRWTPSASRPSTRRRCSRPWRAVALLVYQVVGVGFLRRGWVNVDRVWAGALVTAGTVTLIT